MTDSCGPAPERFRQRREIELKREDSLFPTLEEVSDDLCLLKYLWLEEWSYSSWSAKLYPGMMGEDVGDVCMGYESKYRSYESSRDCQRTVSTMGPRNLTCIHAGVN